MIPTEQLEHLTPLPDQIKRQKLINRKLGRNIPHKLHLTKRQRQEAWFGSSSLAINGKYTGPKGEKWVQVKMKDRKNGRTH